MESIVKVPSNAEDMDFLAFSFNGKHSWDDFGIIRTNDGDRYNENLVPAMQDKTAEVPGGDGMYYFGTTHKQRDFNINIAFDDMSEIKYRKMRQWLNGKEMGDLWFSEAPYKVYTVKPTGTPSLKTLCFDKYNEDTGRNERVYKGEGTIQFTAYWPYAHTPAYVQSKIFVLKKNEETSIEAPVINQQENVQYLYAEVVSPLSFEEIKIEFKLQEKIEDGTLSEFISNIQITPNNLIIDFSDPNYKVLSVSSTFDETVLVKFYYCDENGNNKTPLVSRRDGKDFDSYSEFENRWQWQAASGLISRVELCRGENLGDIPATFTLTYPDNDEVTAYTDIIVGDLKITTASDYYGFQWDSKTGIVSALTTINGVTERRPVSYAGDSLGTIPVGEALEISIPEGGTLKYHYWYY